MIFDRSFESVLFTFLLLCVNIVKQEKYITGGTL